MATHSFTANGTPRDLSRAIEELARASGHVNALVVPWESEASTISMSVTSMKADGWAIEHTDLGTIRLTAASGDSTEVTVTPRDPGPAGQTATASLFDRFAGELQRRLTATAGDAEGARRR